jgi:D-alanyl-lipoteichoic acid acyltransferase DltB (MBOAT superfamily)
MSLTSGSFAAFLAVTLVAFYLVPRRAQNAVLLAASVAFVWTWGWLALGTLTGLTLLNYALGRALPGRPQWLAIGIALNLGALALLRPGGLAAPLLGGLSAASIGQANAGAGLLAPIGLSFYVLAAISYLVDIRQGIVDPCRNLIHFGLYLGYFPKLIAGPIERSRQFLPQLARTRTVDNEAVARSTGLIVLGLFRKLVLADSLRAWIPSEISHNPGELPAPMLVLWIVAWMFSTYNDFAGYTDLARGVSGLFGIQLSRNFATPFYSRTFSELWTRWHISLSSWLRDYVYLPLSRAALRRDPNPRRFAAVWVPPMATLLASGLWHGATPGMLVWGALNGAYLVVERLLQLGRPTRPPDRQPPARQWAGRVMILSLTAAGLVVFLFPLPSAFAYARAILSLDPLAPMDYRLLAFVLPSVAIDWLQIRGKDDLPFLRWPRLAQATLLAVAVLVIFLITRANTVAPFVYQEF